MDSQLHLSEKTEKAPASPDAGEIKLLAPPVQSKVSDDDFENVVRGALESVDGALLFKVQVVDAGERLHAAAAAVGSGENRQFLLLTLPVSGGRLKVETASRSENPLARIAESYAGLMDVMKVAA